MRRSWLLQNADTLAAVVTAIAALAALLYAHLQISEGRRAEREANANELWRETLRLGFDNPKLSDPSLKLADFDYDKLTIDGSRELFQQYEIYVDTVLNASDEILEISPTEPWKTSLRIQLLPHRDYLVSPHFKQSGYLDQYGANLRSLLREIERTIVKPTRVPADQSNIRNWHIADVPLGLTNVRLWGQNEHDAGADNAAGLALHAHATSERGLGLSR